MARCADVTAAWQNAYRAASFELPEREYCEMYRLFTHSGTLGAWKALYCTADFSRCARYVMSTKGQQVAGSGGLNAERAAPSQGEVSEAGGVGDRA
jgi:hypothetical protein